MTPVIVFNCRRRWRTAIPA